MFMTEGLARPFKRLSWWLGTTVLLGRLSAGAAPPSDMPPLPNATRVIGLVPNSATVRAGLTGGVVQPWLSDHEVLHYRNDLLSRFNVISQTETPLPQLTRRVKASHCFIDFLAVSPDGQQVLWGMSGNNPLFVATVDGTRCRQWDGDGGMTQPFWCADAKHWLQFHFGGDPHSLRWTRIQRHGLDSPHASETFRPTPPGLNGLDILAAPSADRIIARKADPVRFIVSSPHKDVRNPDGTDSFVIDEQVTTHITPVISVWSLRRPRPLHQWTIRLPGWVQEVTASPDGARLAWLLRDREGASGALWVSAPDGSGLHKIGGLQSGRHERGQGPDLVTQMNWVPGNKSLSFVSGDALWTVPVR